MAPVEPTDEELLVELRRVRSEVGFRKWVRQRVWFLGFLIVFDLSLSIGVAVGLHRSNQAITRTQANITAVETARGEACARDNRLRQAYIEQWQPLLDEAEKRDDPGSRETVARFSKGLSGFALHPC